MINNTHLTDKMTTLLSDLAIPSTLLSCQNTQLYPNSLTEAFGFSFKNGDKSIIFPQSVYSP